MRNGEVRNLESAPLTAADLQHLHERGEAARERIAQQLKRMSLGARVANTAMEFQYLMEAVEQGMNALDRRILQLLDSVSMLNDRMARLETRLSDEDKNCSVHE